MLLTINRFFVCSLNIQIKSTISVEREIKTIVIVIKHWTTDIPLNEVIHVIPNICIFTVEHFFLRMIEYRENLEV